MCALNSARRELPGVVSCSTAEMVVVILLLYFITIPSPSFSGVCVLKEPSENAVHPSVLGFVSLGFCFSGKIGKFCVLIGLAVQRLAVWTKMFVYLEMMWLIVRFKCLWFLWVVIWVMSPIIHPKYVNWFAWSHGDVP